MTAADGREGHAPAVHSLPGFIEFFSGIGAFRAASAHRVTVLQAFDQDEEANRFYALNFGQWPRSKNLVSLQSRDLHPADGWHLSPPCQPYSRKGRQRDLADPRSAPLRILIERLEEMAPRYILLENVPPFSESEAHRELLSVLRVLGRYVEERTLCPTQLGIPNRRLRYYLLARATPFPPQPQLPDLTSQLGDFLDPSPSPELRVDSSFVARHRRALDLVLPTGVAACFGSSYGHARSRAGSYLVEHDGFRRFSPGEILRLLGFGADVRFPQDTPLATAWRLAGNSMSVPVVRFLLNWLVSERTTA